MQARGLLFNELHAAGRLEEDEEVPVDTENRANQANVGSFIFLVPAPSRAFSLPNCRFYSFVILVKRLPLVLCSLVQDIKRRETASTPG